MQRYGRLLADAQWKMVESCPFDRQDIRTGVGRRLRIAGCWKAFCEFSAAGLAGRTCPVSFLRRRRLGQP